jgi:type II secretory pathway pseudopilin PulG
MVMMVMTILYCIALSAIRAVDRTARKTAARAELKSIETAFKQYYAHYQNWPGVLADDTADRTDMLIDAPLATVLNGTCDNSRGRDDGGNPDKMIFIEFSRMTNDGVPLNPWGASGRYEKDQCRYHVAVDADGDNSVQFVSDNYENANAVKLLPSNRRFRGSVIVWTFNPELTKDNEDYLIGSWQ